MDKEFFEIMVNDFIADHANEFEDNPLTIKGFGRDDFGLVCYAEDSKTSYVLHDDGKRNIVMNYDGTKG